MNPKHVVIIGGGFSGACVAWQILVQYKGSALQISVVEPASELGRGVAYARQQASFELNVPAKKMSLDPSQPDDFVHWLQAQGLPYNSDDYATRDVFGSYVQTRLNEQIVARRGDVRFAHVQSKVIDMTSRADGYHVVLEDGRQIDADIVVIASGLGKLMIPQGLKPIADHSRVILDPWNEAQLKTIADNSHVAVIGMGLTGADIADWLLKNKSANVTLISRHGLSPRAHYSDDDRSRHTPLNQAERLAMQTIESPAVLVRMVRKLCVARQAQGLSWQAVFDALREDTALIWSRWSVRDKQRFVRHVRPFWEVHRHRIVPRLARTLARAHSERRLVYKQGHIRTAKLMSARIALNLRTKERLEAIEVDHVVLCTGAYAHPLQEAAETRQSFETTLVRHGLARIDAIGVGLEVDDKAQLATNLFALGARCRSARWETTAVPELAAQAKMIASTIVGMLTCVVPARDRLALLSLSL